MAMEQQRPTLGPQRRQQLGGPLLWRQRQRPAQPLLQRLGPGQQQGCPLAELVELPLQARLGGLVEFRDLGHIQSTLQHTATGGDQHQIVIHQGGGQGHRATAHQGAAATDQPHAAVVAHLQIGAGQAAGLPEALQKMAGTVVVAAGQGQQPATGGRAAGGGAADLGRRIVEQHQGDSRGQPPGQFIVVIEAGGGKGPIPQPLDSLAGIAALAAWSHRPGIGHRLLPIAEQIEAQGSLGRHKAGRPGDGEGVMGELQRSPLPDQPPAPHTKAEGEQHHGQHHRQKGAALHARTAGWVHPDALPVPMPDTSTPEAGSATPMPISASELQARLLAGEAIQLVDVREDNELELAQLAHPVLHLPLSRSQDWIGQIDSLIERQQPVAVLCHAGVRSWHFGCWLIQEHGHPQVWNLQGGIDAWSTTVDRSVPRY